MLRAIEIARSQEAHLLELRAATDLARLWRDTGSPNDSNALLEPILAAIEAAKPRGMSAPPSASAGGDRVINISGLQPPNLSAAGPFSPVV